MQGRGDMGGILLSDAQKAERAPREALYRAEMLKWRIEGGRS
jgi:hypothetical protein